MLGRTVEAYLDHMYEEDYVSSCRLTKNRKGTIIGKTYTVQKGAEIALITSGTLVVVEAKDQVLLHTRGTNSYPTAVTIKKHGISPKSFGHRQDIPFVLIKTLSPRFL